MFNFYLIESESDFNELVNSGPIVPSIDNGQPINFNKPPEGRFYYEIDDLEMIQVDDKDAFNAVPDKIIDGLIAFFTKQSGLEMLTPQNAKSNAFDMWNHCQYNFPQKTSFVDHLNSIFTTFNNIIKRKAFFERRIHRYINEYASFLLPAHKSCHYECVLLLDDEQRKADFILERETGLPPILIELENPSNALFKKNLEPTAEAQHARNQICEWERFIKENPNNTKDQMSFLKGTLEKLVVIGKGLENLDTMKAFKYSDTAFWTYDLLLYEAIDRCNKAIFDQCKAIGIGKPNLIRQFHNL